MPSRLSRKFNDCHLRIIIVGTIFFILWIIIVIRLAQLQIIEYGKYKEASQKLRTIEKEETGERGQIFVEELNKKISIALSSYHYTLIAEPINIKESVEAAVKIAEILDIPIDEENENFKNLLIKLSKKNSQYEIVRKDLSQSQVEKIKNLSLTGLYFEKEIKRFYPEGNCLSHLLGFYGYRGDQKVGRYGIEEFYENILSGKDGIIKGERARTGALISTIESTVKESQDGSDIVLTIDRTIQSKSCEILEESVNKFGAESGTIIIVNPKTGEVLSLCNFPGFDPNQYSLVKDFNLFINSAISHYYEPGSVFKVITFAAAIDDGKIKPDDKFEDTGSIKISGHTIKNAAEKIYGKVTMREILEKSINTGVIFIARQIGSSGFLSWVKKFGFEEKTRIDLPTETVGDLRNLYQKNEIYLATASFGQGITVTPIQMLMSFAVIANQGKLMKPYIVKEIISQKNSYLSKPEEVRQVISPQTSEIIKDLMISAVENGWGKRAGVKGYLVAGKTGTAEVARSGGYSSETIHSFIGFAPADNPRFVAIVKIDNPTLVNFSDQTAAPAFGQLADFILKYYQIPPTEE
ncbi:MAG: penicillin-binding protein 2 [Bacteroidetes bacterium]|nr:penicillin-binding protein 2 [Bacteroidota bacterium]